MLDIRPLLAPSLKSQFYCLYLSLHLFLYLTLKFTFLTFMYYVYTIVLTFVYLNISIPQARKWRAWILYRMRKEESVYELASSIWRTIICLSLPIMTHLCLLENDPPYTANWYEHEAHSPKRRSRSCLSFHTFRCPILHDLRTLQIHFHNEVSKTLLIFLIKADSSTVVLYKSSYDLEECSQNDNLYASPTINLLNLSFLFPQSTRCTVCVYHVYVHEYIYKFLFK